ncbi:agmatine deiminase family protein [Rufibacter quisquiliarum]|uniref:Agmatine deiminase n=1 Tax=Rufibacter quisquiliarum TaxID=1549639 RepID=A0A839GH30_9BACT|nr:agmatine deiminase family protein [Rufibacter quisquiliarum]MBA9078202.1 agmatine deiminase [Rufibacter quisquiliarum]
MVTDSEKNLLYLADTLPQFYPTFCQSLEHVLRQHEVNYSFLPKTKDVWAVDYMPVQVASDRFVQFVYNPDYLQTIKLRKTISDVDAICATMGVVPVKSPIVLDGGNVIRSKYKVIMCDKVFRENPSVPEKRLIKELSEYLEVDHVIFIPTDKADKIGHADGMVRFLDNHTVLINDYSKEKPEFQSTFRMALHNAGLNWVEIPYNPYDNIEKIQANGIYINYLEMEGTIILPTFGIREDEMAAKQMENLFPNYNLAIVNSNEIADDGGVLNCISWNIKLEG